MKTEDIDKRIGMPDVDKEWARFEQEVIDKQPKANKRFIYSWIGGLGIAACLLLFFLINIGDEPKLETPVVAEQTETQPVQQPATEEVKEEPIIHIVNTPQAKKTPRKKLLACADVPSSSGLEISTHEYAGAVQKPKMDDLEDLAFESVDQALQDNARELHEVSSLTEVSKLQGVIAGLPDAPPNDSILYIVNGVPQPKENNKWLGKMSYLDYFKGQHLLVDSVKRNMNEEAKQRYLERFGMAAKHGVVEYFCVEDTLCDYYMNQHEELKASRRRVSGVVLDENGEPLDHTLIHILQIQPEKKIWGVETTDSLGNFAFWVPRTGVKMHFKYIGYEAVVVEPTDTFQTIHFLPEATMQSINEE